MLMHSLYFKNLYKLIDKVMYIYEYHMWDSLLDSYGMVREDKEEIKNSQKLEQVNS